MSEVVEVTQADREAAAPFMHGAYAGSCLAGLMDDAPGVQAFARHRTAALASAEAEITRLRGLLIDPGHPAWEDARAVLAAELRKAGLADEADAAEEAEAVSVPSWIALNLIGQASRAIAPGDAGEAERGFKSAVHAIRAWADGFYDEANRSRLRAVAQDLENNRDAILGTPTHD